MATLTPQPLTAEAFAPFGDVIEARPDGQHNGTVIPINDGYTQRFHDLATIDVAEQNGRPLVSIFRSQPLPLPLQLHKLERHPLASQAFMPLSGEPYLVVVAPAGDLDPKAIKAFTAKPHQGVNYHRGTWHHFCLALNKPCDFLVIDRGGDGHNCDEAVLEGGLHIVLG
ncbi:ureidoglycolate lyase [Simiduia aestuariiviva]|uniref:Ureidoglycolate lyase n=1 Tax=Simiduia aestuariiviva TaxID=1510459 RepID=A0A839UQS6_9GAMM|nr:ureidoglycolate lyase [Simiduia aestuariiviva]MBB3170192.1 ureidoglycolate lyase [Simiduia aestuariiviva]